MMVRARSTAWSIGLLLLALCATCISAEQTTQTESSDVLSQLSFAPLALPRASNEEPMYLTSRLGRATVLRTQFDPAGGVGMQQDIGHGFARRESAAGAEGLSAEPCYGPGPCFGDSPTNVPKPAPKIAKPCPKPAPLPPPPPPPAATPAPTPVPVTPPPPPPPAPVKDEPFPEPANPDNPVPPPATPDCGAFCTPADSDPSLVKVPSAPLSPIALAKVVKEDTPLARIQNALQKRQQHLENQKAWLVKAAEAVNVVKREIARAQKTEDEIKFDIDQLKRAQDVMSTRYRADQLKWRYKDLKFTLERLKVKADYVDDYKQELLHKTQEKQNEITVLKNSLPQEHMEYLLEEELDNPTKIIEEIEHGNL